MKKKLDADKEEEIEAKKIVFEMHEMNTIEVLAKVCVCDVRVC